MRNRQKLVLLSPIVIESWFGLAAGSIVGYFDLTESIECEAA